MWSADHPKMVRLFETEVRKVPGSSPGPSELEVAGLLRRAARDLAQLEQFPLRPGRQPHLEAASDAIQAALVELESDNQ